MASLENLFRKTWQNLGLKVSFETTSFGGLRKTGNPGRRNQEPEGATNQINHSEPGARPTHWEVCLCRLTVQATGPGWAWLLFPLCIGWGGGGSHANLGPGPRARVRVHSPPPPP